MNNKKKPKKRMSVPTRHRAPTERINEYTDSQLSWIANNFGKYGKEELYLKFKKAFKMPLNRNRLAGLFNRRGGNQAKFFAKYRTENEEPDVKPASVLAVKKAPLEAPKPQVKRAPPQAEKPAAKPIVPEPPKPAVARQAQPEAPKPAEKLPAPPPPAPAFSQSNDARDLIIAEQLQQWKEGDGGAKSTAFSYAAMRYNQEKAPDQKVLSTENIRRICGEGRMLAEFLQRTLRISRENAEIIQARIERYVPPQA